jgi:putative selenate reductase
MLAKTKPTHTIAGQSETMRKITTIHDHDRAPTQDLLQQVYAAIAEGETQFEIEASGQHDIGGPLWDAEGRPLHFLVRNPGQRVGAFGLPGTEVVVEGPAPADVGWLNAGARITVRGDAGDTAGHCAADGVIYIGGRAGTRSGSLMKHDPAADAPQLWILKNTGSFPFEFMGGGVAVVCGHDCSGLSSVLGDRACMGMVGGTVYVRGPVKGLAPNVVIHETLNDEDWDFLTKGMPAFLQSIERDELLEELSERAEWRKIVARTKAETNLAHPRPSMLEFRQQEWVKGGIFGDVVVDSGELIPLVAQGTQRSLVPVWKNAVYSSPCVYACPVGIPTPKRINLLRKGNVKEALELVLQYTPFPGSVCGAACPNPCMDACTRAAIDSKVLIGPLGTFSKDLPAPQPEPATGKSYAVIGAGVAGLTAAWVLALRGHAVTVYDRDESIGGKMFAAIPHERLDKDIVLREVERIRSLGVRFELGVNVDRNKFEAIKAEHDGVIVAVGASTPRTISFPGAENAIPATAFLTDVNKCSPAIDLAGKAVVVIGAGDVGMDACVAAWEHGARSVTAVDIREPASSDKERGRAIALGTRLVWPVSVQSFGGGKVTFENGAPARDADVLISAIGDVPETGWLPESLPRVKQLWLAADASGRTSDPKVYAAGDAVKPGLLADAVGAGRNAALAADADSSGQAFQVQPKTMIPREKLHLAHFPPAAAPASAMQEGDRCISCGLCRDCGICVSVCFQNAIRREEHAGGEYEYVVRDDLCIACGFCAAACPCGIWTMEPNPARDPAAIALRA